MTSLVLKTVLGQNLNRRGILAFCGGELATSVMGHEGQPSPVMGTVMDLNLGVLLPDLNLEK